MKKGKLVSPRGTWARKGRIVGNIVNTKLRWEVVEERPGVKPQRPRQG